MPSYEDTMKRFEQRMEEKPKVVLFPFDASLKLTIKAVDDQSAEQTLKIIVAHLSKFDDIMNVEGKWS
jgi:hypothetical protein